MLGEQRSDDVKSENQKTIVIPIGVRAALCISFRAVRSRSKGLLRPCNRGILRLSDVT